MSELNLIVFFVAAIDRIWKYTRISSFFAGAAVEVDTSPNDAKQETQLAAKTETVTIVQPILSGDPTIWRVLADNLRFASSYQIDYIWAIDDDDKLAQSECLRVLAEYQKSTPQPRPVKILSLPAAPADFSPKTFKIVEGFKLSSADILINLDDDTTLPDNALEIVGPLLSKPTTGAVFAVPFYKSFGDTWSSFISSFVNGFSTWSYIPYTCFIRPFTINGMFYAVRRTVYDKVDGLYGLEKDICDDYVFGQRLINHGYYLVQAPLLHPISIKVKDLRHCLNIIKRWFVFTNASVMTSTTKNLIVFYTVVFAALFHPFTLLLLFLVTPTWLSATLLISYVVLHLYTAHLVNKNYLGGVTPWWGLVVNELYSFVLPLHATWTLLVPKRINWRGNVMQVTASGKFKLVEPRHLLKQVK
ncbi:MAG: hypothetical protein IPP97_09025 [Candidatus Obscuribacter sp.]|nr:hypothetical protein [Candidatus Obscuribacter sp.]